jgi:hypothetical protein
VAVELEHRARFGVVSALLPGLLAGSVGLRFLLRGEEEVEGVPCAP